MSKLDKIEELQGLIKEDSSNFQARRELAVLLMDCGFNEEALQHLLYLSKMFSFDEGIFYNLGIVYEKMKQFSKAREAYEKAIDIEPESMDAIYNLGLVYTELKEYDKAVDCFKQVIESDNMDSNSYFNLGLIYFKQKDYLNAIEYFQKTIDINDEDIYAHFYIGNIYKELGDKDSAKEEFEKVINLSPDYSWAYFNIAVIDYEDGNIVEAEENLKKTIDLNKMDEEAYKILIKILLKNEEYEDANKYAKMRIEYCSETGDADYLLAQTYKSMGLIDDYENALQNAIRNSQTLSIPIEKIKTELRNIKNEQS